MKDGKTRETIKRKRVSSEDLFRDPVEDETSEDVGMTFECALGTKGGLDMSSINHRVNSRLWDVACDISSGILERLPSGLANYVGHSTRSPYDFNLKDKSTLSLKMSRRMERGDGYSPMTGQTSWGTFVETFGSVSYPTSIPRAKDIEFIMRVFVKDGVKMAKLMLADLFCSGLRWPSAWRC